MTCHSVIAYQSSTARQFPLDDDRWRSYVPLRLPATMCVQEQLPRGAAGVLLNRSHPFHDLILVIDPKEKSMLDLIDGRRNIAEIINDADVDSPAGRSFFERLWRYDQIVFAPGNF